MSYLIGMFIVLGLILLVVVGLAIWQCVKFFNKLSGKF